MSKFEPKVKKAWVSVAAVVLIAGSSSAMAFALNSNVPAYASENAVSVNATGKGNIQNQTAQSQVKAGYSVIDLSKTVPEQKEMIKKKLSMTQGITPEQIDEKCNALISSLTPGSKDISAGQAAAYAAGVLEKAYGVNFKGYTAEARFSSSSVPNSDNWIVAFYSPEDFQKIKQYPFVKSYIATVNSVNGTIVNASFVDPHSTNDNKDLNDPVWMQKAEQDISALLPGNVTIKSSKIISASPEAGVAVVSELSNGTAYAVRLSGENKEAIAYIFFPNGYDGSLNQPAFPKNAGR